MHHRTRRIIGACAAAMAATASLVATSAPAQAATQTIRIVNLCDFAITGNAGYAQAGDGFSLRPGQSTSLTYGTKLVRITAHEVRKGGVGGTPWSADVTLSIPAGGTRTWSSCIGW